MSRDTCRMPNCENIPGSAETEQQYRSSRFCSSGCDLQYSRLKDDARQARLDAAEEVA